jgi:hypothetical protein
MMGGKGRGRWEKTKEMKKGKQDERRQRKMGNCKGS